MTAPTPHRTAPGRLPRTIGRVLLAAVTTAVLTGCSSAVSGHDTTTTTPHTASPTASSTGPSPTAAPSTTERATNTTSPAATTAPPNPVAVYYGRCWNGPSDGPLDVEPPTATFGCDGTGDLTNLHWSAWATTGADATGTAALNDCNPGCANGREHYFTVVVHLAAPQLIPELASCANGGRFWSTLTVAFPNGWPATLFGGPPPTRFHGLPAESYPALPSVQQC